MMVGETKFYFAWHVMRFILLNIAFNLTVGSLWNAIVNVKYNKHLFCSLGNDFVFFSSLLGMYLFWFVVQTSFRFLFHFQLCHLFSIGFFSVNILDICESILFLLRFYVLMQ